MCSIESPKINIGADFFGKIFIVFYSKWNHRSISCQKLIFYCRMIEIIHDGMVHNLVHRTWFDLTHCVRKTIWTHIYTTTGILLAIKLIFVENFKKNYLPRDDDKIMSGYFGLVAIWVTHPLWPIRVPRRWSVSVIFLVLWTFPLSRWVNYTSIHFHERM